VAGTVYIAPAGQHLTISRRATSKATIHLGTIPENSLHMPSVDVMMLSAAENFRSLCMGVILTGMGADGAKGMQAIQKEGGITVGQDEASCTVYGMPRSCAELGVVQRVVPLQQVPEQILQITHYKQRA
jgi:two-component system chemotaxis response regulator CheB